MKHIKNSSLQRLLGLIIIDSIFFAVTNPMNVASAVLIVAFMLTAATFYSAIQLGIKAVAWYRGKTLKNQQRIALGVTGLVSGVIALQSVGQLSGRDLMVALPLVTVAYVYTSYGRSLAD